MAFFGGSGVHPEQWCLLKLYRERRPRISILYNSLCFVTRNLPRKLKSLLFEMWWERWPRRCRNSPSRAKERHYYSILWPLCIFGVFVNCLTVWNFLCSKFWILLSTLNVWCFDFMIFNGLCNVQCFTFMNEMFCLWYVLANILWLSWI